MRVFDFVSPKRVSFAVAVAACSGLASAGPAMAGGASVSNACSFSAAGRSSGWLSVDGESNGQANLSQVGVGDSVILRGTNAKVSLKPFGNVDDPQLQSALSTALALGVFRLGEYEVPLDVTAAIAATNASPKVQIVRQTLKAKVNVYRKANGSITVSDVNVTVPFADTTWKAETPGSIKFSQGAAGALAAGGATGVAKTAKGSLYVVGTRPDGINIPAGILPGDIPTDTSFATADCQPGTASKDGTTLTTAVAPAFETVAVDGAGSSGSKSRKSPAILSKSLKRKGNSVSVKVRNRNSTARKLSVSLRSSKGKTVAKGSKKIPAGAKRTVKLKLTSVGKQLLKSSSRVKVKISASDGAIVRVKSIRLSR